MSVIYMLIYLHVNKKGESLNITINKTQEKYPCTCTQYTVIIHMNKFLYRTFYKEQESTNNNLLSRVNIITFVRLVLIRFCLYREPEVINNIKSLVQNQK